MGLDNQTETPQRNDETLIALFEDLYENQKITDPNSNFAQNSAIGTLISQANLTPQEINLLFQVPANKKIVAFKKLDPDRTPPQDVTNILRDLSTEQKALNILNEETKPDTLSQEDLMIVNKNLATLKDIKKKDKSPDYRAETIILDTLKLVSNLTGKGYLKIKEIINNI
ncbi:MAG: hypothetical protein OEL89_04390 [Candidatus Peregrinibacteria bacterium]|nr:hypothetical protein [Candidatus Peregrinibacteria bacterium]